MRPYPPRRVTVLPAVMLVLTALLAPTAQAAPGDGTTLRVLVHQNPPMVEFVEAFNASFEDANPNITVDMSVVSAGELATVTQTRLSAQDVDVIDIFGFSNAVQDYMPGATPPAWQQLIEAGLLLDITDQSFVQFYDDAAINNAGSYDGGVYSVNLGRVVYSGMFVNTDLLADVGVAIPTTWSDLVSACEAVIAAGHECMTVGGADGWPVYVGSYGLLGALYPDQEGLVEGLWTRAVRWNDEATLTLWNRYKTYAQDMLEDGARFLSHWDGPTRYAVGDVAFMPTGVWQAPALEDAGPGFSWTYVPFPGSDNAADNQYLFGKYDQGWSIAANVPDANQQAALAYVAAFSEPDNYQAFINAVGFIPTQPTASLETKLAQEIAPYLANFRVGFEQHWVSPSGAGQWANGSLGASWFVPFGEWDDATALASQAQMDLEAGLPITEDVFVDDDDSVFEDDIEWLAAMGITKGCNPPANDRFCPDSNVTRGQMAAFLVRALDLPAAPSAGFTDTVGTTFEMDIDKLAAAGITKGCNPPDNDRFCPDDKVRREVMAAFLVRALKYTDDGGGDLFIDDDGSIFESDIDKLATAGVTKGCNPPVNDRFCPTENVTRGQMAAFLHRALG